jgi:hypothetical protein
MIYYTDTLGKSTENFEETVNYEGKEYKIYLIACVYTSG